MNALRSSLSLAILALLTTAASAQAPAARNAAPQQRSGGITDIMRAGPSVAVPPPAAPARTAPPVQRAAEYIVALVNSEPITNTQVQKRVDRVLQEAGAQAAGVPAEQVLHVGDDAALDVLGAHAAGMQTVWVNRGEDAWTHAVQPHVSVADLRALCALF